MKPALALSALAAIGASALGQSASHTPQLLRTQTAFNIVVHLPFADAAHVFGPEGERAWAGTHWDPHFIYPQPAHDEQDAVFTIQHGSFTAVWINTLFDIEAGHLQYSYFIPDVMVTSIDVRLTAVDSSITQVRVVYTRTALTTSGNEHVTSFTEVDKAAGRSWQSAIDLYIATLKP
jgi:hypothetical protein